MVERSIDVREVTGSSPVPPTMKILGIETSCDETALALLEGSGSFNEAKIRVMDSALISQVDVHREYGGVFPSLAKREHIKNLIPLLEKVLKGGKMLQYKIRGEKIDDKTLENLREILNREPDLFEAFIDFVPKIKKPAIEAVTVTTGPGLEPALWVGINFAKALAEFWKVPIVATNHMEGHIAASLISDKSFKAKASLKKIKFPAMALLISGGHTQLVLIKDWKKYQVIGETRDDAVGEAYDKVARMMGLTYPGGPEIARLAELGRIDKKLGQLKTESFKLPRPMLNSDDFDFSFSGLKTSVLYLIKKKSLTNPILSEQDKIAIATEFEAAVTEVLIKKTKKAIEANGIKTLILGGGVTANTFICQSFDKIITKEFPDIKIYLPEKTLSTDNAVMIALAGYFNRLQKTKQVQNIKADGNLRFV